MLGLAYRGMTVSDIVAKVVFLGQMSCLGVLGRD